MTLIEKIWFERHWSAILLWPLLKPLSILFGWIASRRREAFASGAKASYRAPVPVVVVGNVTVGGNGKTPVVILLVETLQAMGYKPGVVSRGYGGKAASYPLLVSDSVTTGECGDEPKLIARRTGAPVVVDPQRSQAVKVLLEHGVDIVITDDGLQHYALERDVEIVVIDGKRRFGNQSLLPFGPLREPLSRLDEVDFLICNGSNAQPNEYAMHLAPSLAVNLVTGEKKPASQLGDCVAIAGIGHPPRFFATLGELGVKLSKTVGFSDHQDLKASDLNAISSSDKALIMTEKDAVKCSAFAQRNWWYLPVDAKLADSALAKLRQRLQQEIEHYGS